MSRLAQVSGSRHVTENPSRPKDPEYAYDYLYYDYYDGDSDYSDGKENSNRRRKYDDVKMNAILERALEKVNSAKRRISEAVRATSSGTMDAIQ